MLRFPPFWRSVCVSGDRRGTTPGGRSQTRSRAPHRPSPVTSARGLPGGLRVLGTALPAVGLLRGDDTGWLAPHRAWPCIAAPVTIRGRLGAVPRIAGPRFGCLRPTPQLLDFLFFSFSPLFSLWWQIWVSFLASFLPSFLFFFFSFAAGGVGRRGSSLESFSKRPGAVARVLWGREQLGTGRRCRRPGRGSSLALPGQASLCPWSPGPVRRPGASLPSSGGSVTAPGCWLSSGSPLALMQRPPTSRRPTTNQRLAVPL